VFKGVLWHCRLLFGTYIIDIILYDDMKLIFAQNKRWVSALLLAAAMLDGKTKNTPRPTWTLGQ
jgi:hypothetical protein